MGNFDTVGNLDVDSAGQVGLAFKEGITPWHSLGQEKPADEVWTRGQWMSKANTDFVVTLEQIGTMDSGIVIPDSKAIVRTDTSTVMGVTGNRYECYQNDDLYRLLEQYGEFATMGSLGGGSVVFGLIELGNVTVGCEDIRRYLLGAAGHDGKTGVDIKSTDVATVCQNTFDMAFAGAGRKWSAKHTQNISARIASIDEELAAIFDGSAVKALTDEIERMLSQEVNDRIVEEVLDEAFPKGNKAVSMEAWTVRGLYEQHPTVRDRNGTDCRGTAWGLYQATSFFDLWSKDVRGDRLERQAFATLDDNPTPNARKVAQLLTRV